MLNPRAVVVALATSTLVPAAAFANDRHFTFTYESAVLPQEAKELEVWTTPRLGRSNYFARFDNRLEFEVGLTNRLQTSVYLNYIATTADVETMPGQLARESAFAFDGVSSEWKYKVTDPVANALGFAVYAEITGSTDELELEGKLIFDKMIGRLLLAANLIGEYEMELVRTGAAAMVDKAVEAEIDLACAFFVRPNVALGLELRNANEIKDGEWEHSALFLGPVVAYATPSWWVALTLMPQLPALKNEGGGSYVLDEHEYFNARLLFSYHL
jgi:hypothetical protein